MIEEKERGSGETPGLVFFERGAGSRRRAGARRRGGSALISQWVDPAESSMRPSGGRQPGIIRALGAAGDAETETASRANRSSSVKRFSGTSRLERPWSDERSSGSPRAGLCPRTIQDPRRHDKLICDSSARARGFGATASSTIHRSWARLARLGEPRRCHDGGGRGPVSASDPDECRGPTPA